MKSQLVRTSIGLASAGILTAAASAQSGVLSQKHRGNAAEWPLAVVVEDPAGGTNNMPGMRVKPARDQPSIGYIPPAKPQSQLGPGGQSFHFSSLFPGLPDIEIDAMSSGNGVILGHVGGVATLNGGWMGVSASVAHRTPAPGETDPGAPGSHFRIGHNKFSTAGSEIATYYLQASQGISPILVGKQVLETNRGHLGLNNDPTNTPNTDVKAMDYGIGVNVHNVLLPEAIFFRHRDAFFFSVTKEWANANQSLDFATAHDVVGPVPPSGTDVYYKRYDFENDVWSPTFLYARGQDLGFDTSGTQDLDALDVDLSNSNIVFSAELDDVLALNGSQSQLMIIDLDGPNSVGLPLSAPNQASPLLDDIDPLPGPQMTAVFIADELGIGADELDAVCTIDPEAGTLSTQAGTAYMHDPAFGDPMGLSCIKIARPGATEQTWSIQVNGWGTSPFGGGSGAPGIPGGPGVPGAANLAPGAVKLFHRQAPIQWNGPFPTTGWTELATMPRQASLDSVVQFSVPESLINVLDGESTPHQFIAYQYDRSGRQIIRKSWVSAFVDAD